MLDRLAELCDPAGKHGPDGPIALKALAERGLDQAVIDQAASLLLALARPTAESADTTIERDETALWRWYLEWAAIARTEIKERALLRRMGLRLASGAAEDEGKKKDAKANGDKTARDKRENEAEQAAPDDAGQDDPPTVGAASTADP
jgi:hypothetical protein